MRAAAIANLFMALANNGGLNAFLTSSQDLDAADVVLALQEVGAGKAATQLAGVLAGLAVPLPVMSQDQRWHLLDQHWHDDLDRFDVLPQEADDELLRQLGQHVAANETFYSRLA